MKTLLSVLGLSLALGASGADVAAQAHNRLSRGDLIRIDSRVVGRVLSVSNGQIEVLPGTEDVSEPRPDTVRISRAGTVIERAVGGGPQTALGAAIGGLAFGLVGAALGPKMGWGSERTCSGINIFGCTSHTAEEDARQTGMLVFGLLGAGLGALIGHSVGYQWAEVAPHPISNGDLAWSLAVNVSWPAR
jgi:hypothetical protein